MMPKNPGDHEQDGAGATGNGLYPNLSAADERAVDLLIEHGFDLDAAVQANPSEAKRLAAEMLAQLREVRAVLSI